MKTNRINLYEEAKRLAENIIENEYQHISDYRELEFTDTNIEYKNADGKYREVFDKLGQIMPKEYVDLLGQLEDEMTERMWLLCRFYFKQGVIAGSTSLDCIKEINGINIDCII